MRLHHSLILLVMTLFFSTTQALEVKEDEQYIYNIHDFAEIAEENQRELINYFINFLQSKLDQLSVPTHWTNKIEQTFLGDTISFFKIIDDLSNHAKSCALAHSIRPELLVPTGFLVGFGVSGSGEYIVGLGGSVLLTLTVVPLKIERFDKLTKKTKTYYEGGWSIGGLGQGGVGVGEGGKIAFHGAIGLIWGDMPQASSLTGPAIGLTASFGQIQGLGLKAAFAINTTTHHYNLVAMATYDVGAQSGGEVSGAAFYFMNLQEVLKYVSNQNAFVLVGKEIIDAINLTPIAK